MNDEVLDAEGAGAFERAVQEYFVSVRWHERALANVEKARAEVARASESKRRSYENLQNFANDPDEVSRVCFALLEDQ